MATGRQDWQQNRSDRQNDRQDWRDQNREDWQNFADDHHDQHGDWYHDSWQPGDHWNYMWDNYPVAAALGVTAWGVNRLAYGMGYEDYSNPYSEGGGGSGGYDYSEPLVTYAEPAPTTAEAAPPTEAASEATDPGMQAFNDARTEFAAGNAEKALTLLDTTLKTMPRDTVVHEFRSLVLFALKRYPESAAALYAVLSAGPGWDWTTMIGLYSNAETYTQQLRALEAFANANPKSADAHFLLGYHYLTGTHAAAANTQFKLAQAQLPDDKLLTQLVGMSAPAGTTSKTEPSAPAEPLVVPESQVLTVEKMVGTWKASSKSAQFQLELAKDGHFVWSFTRGKDKQSVKGAFAVDQNNLAMEPDAGGTMLAVIDFVTPTQFNFRMIGGDAKDPGLIFNQEK
jgi:tetratricopeptide (TPR) repeat protein